MNYNPYKIDRDKTILQIEEDIQFCKQMIDVYILTNKNDNFIIKISDNVDDIFDILFTNYENYKDYKLLEMYNFFKDFKKNTNKYKTYGKFTIYKYGKCFELGNKTVQNMVNEFKNQMIFKKFIRKKKINLIWKTSEL